MYQTKSFDLNTDEERSKATERLYEPLKCRCLKYFAIPALIAFMLLLILVNVDFDTTTTTNPTSTFRTTENEVQTTPLATLPEDLINMRLGTTVVQAKGRISGYCLNINCVITCRDGLMNNLGEALAVEKGSCEEINVIVTSANFPSEKIDANLLRGDYNAKSFTVSGTDLSKIEAKAFDQAAFAHLESISLMDTKIYEVSEEIFYGLPSLLQFTLKSSPKTREFAGLSFLKPLASTLTTFEILIENTSTKQDPTKWLQGSDLPKLTHVQFQRNFFRNSLNSKTFVTLINVEQLILTDCSITSIAPGTFEPIMSTLQYLDLRRNELISLDWNFLSFISPENNLRLELSDNTWNCTCDNFDIINALKTSQINNGIEPTCSHPSELVDVEMKDVQLNCQDESDESTTKATDATTRTTYLPTDPEEPNNITSSLATTFITDSDTSSAESSSTMITSSTTTIGPIITFPTTDPLDNFIVCSNTTHTLHVNVSPPCVVVFSISSISPTSIEIKIEVIGFNLNLIYFASKSYSVSFLSISSNTMKIEQLKNDKMGYVICIVSGETNQISPFNCRSHYLEEPSRRAFLSVDDKVWSILLFVTLIIIFIISGIFISYGVLRCRPTWVCGSKRLIRVDSKSNKAMLLSQDANDITYRDLSSITYVKNDSNIIDLDYMEFYRNLENSLYRKLHHSVENLPPIEEAPIAPRCRNQHQSASSGSTLPIDEYNEYESIEYYQKIY